MQEETGGTMIQFNGIETFNFKSAEYSMVGKHGDAAILRVDYEHNSFELVKRSGSLADDFQREATRIAHDLLSRKHGINVAAPADVISPRA
jgi:hypothetical protein